MTLTHLPASYAGDAIGEISEKMVNEPSNGRSGLGLPIVPATLATTLYTYIYISVPYFCF